MVLHAKMGCMPLARASKDPWGRSDTAGSPVQVYSLRMMTPNICMFDQLPCQRFTGSESVFLQGKAVDDRDTSVSKMYARYRMLGLLESLFCMIINHPILLDTLYTMQMTRMKGTSATRLQTRPANSPRSV
jgi:hypothetical protein